MSVHTIVLLIALLSAPLLYKLIMMMVVIWEKANGRQYPYKRWVLPYMIATGVVATVAVVILEITT